MNRQTLLALLKKQGYSGDGADISAVLKFLEEGLITLTDERGNVYSEADIKRIHSKAVEVQIRDTETGEGMAVTGEPQPMGGEPEGAEMEGDTEEKMEDEEEKGDYRKSQRPSRGKNINQMLKAGHAPSFMDRNSDGARYEQRIKMHGVGGGNRQAKFHDVDRAEAFGAAFRDSVCKQMGIANPRATEDRQILRKASSTVNFNQGGAFVPEDFATDLIYIVEDFGVARRVCGTEPMAENTKTVPRSKGGITMSWGAENVAASESDMSTDQVELVARKLIGLHRYSNEILTDSAINIADQVATEFAQAQAEAEDDAFFNGDGTQEYGGHTGVIESLKGLGTNPEDAAGLQLASGDVWSEITLADIESMFGTLPHYSGRYGSPKLCCTKQFLFQVFLPLYAARLGTNFEDLRANGLATEGSGGADFSIMGYDGYYTQKMPSVATGTAARDTVPLLFGHFDVGAKFGDRSSGLDLATSTERYFEFDQFGVRSTSRIAINVHDVGDTTNAGPIVGLIMEDA